MSSWLRWGTLAAMLALALAPAGPADAARDIVGPAFVQKDGLLRIGRYWIRLHGVYIPDTGRQCRTRIVPAYCGTRAAVALDTRIQGFVFCRPISRNADGTLNAFCAVERTFRSAGEDLGAYLIARGLALALPGAPFQYVALERIAQARGFGLWGFPVDMIN